MKVLLINGSPHEKGCTYTALSLIAGELNAAGIETEILNVGTKPVGGCIGCGGCAAGKGCVFGGVVNEAIEKAKTADAFVFGTPVHYASASGNMTSFMDRLAYAGGRYLAYKPAAICCSARRAGTTIHPRPAGEVPRVLPYAAGERLLLAHGPRLEPRAGAAGRRGLRRHAGAGPQHGLAAPVHRGRQSRRHPAPGESPQTHDQLYTLSFFKARAAFPAGTRPFYLKFYSETDKIRRGFFFRS